MKRPQTYIFSSLEDIGKNQNYIFLRYKNNNVSKIYTKMVFAYSSAILIVQYNSTLLNQTNFGLCVFDLISVLFFFFVVSFWYCLPYNSVIVNNIYILCAFYSIAYDSTSIYLFINDKPVENYFFNWSVVTIVLVSIHIIFEFVRKCFGVRHYIDRFVDDDFSDTSSQFYAIRDMFSEFCCTDDCCGSCDEWVDNCCNKIGRFFLNMKKCCASFDGKYRKAYREAAIRRKHRIPKSSTPYVSKNKPNNEPDHINEIPTAQVVMEQV